MARYPRIDSPCPYKDRLASVMDGDFCRMCERQVFDLGGWTDEERVAFLAGCGDKVCVSYRLPIRPALAAAALAATIPAAAIAQEVPAAPAEARIERADVIYVVVGGINDPRRARYVETGEDGSVPELPVVYEGQAESGADKSPTADSN